MLSSMAVHIHFLGIVLRKVDFTSQSWVANPRSRYNGFPLFFSLSVIVIVRKNISPDSHNILAVISTAPFIHIILRISHYRNYERSLLETRWVLRSWVHVIFDAISTAHFPWFQCTRIQINTVSLFIRIMYQILFLMSWIRSCTFSCFKRSKTFLESEAIYDVYCSTVLSFHVQIEHP